MSNKIQSFKTHFVSLICSDVNVDAGLPQGLSSKEFTCSARDAGDVGLIPGLGRSPGGGHGNPLLCSCLGESHGQRSLAGYSPWGRKESDTTEQLTLPLRLSGGSQSGTW